MEAALAWYRARGAVRGPLGPIRVPTLYIWGDADDTVGRVAAEAPGILSQHPFNSKSCPASDISRPTRRRNGSANCYWRISRLTRADGTGRRQKCCPAAIGHDDMASERHPEKIGRHGEQAGPGSPRPFATAADPVPALKRRAGTAARQ